MAILVIAVIVVSVAGSLYVFYRPAPVPETIDSIQIGSPVKYNLRFFTAVLAEEKGFFKENRLKVQWIPFPSGPDQMKAIAAGETPLGFGTVQTVMMSIQQGLPVKVTAVIGRQSNIFWIVRSDSPIKTEDDLKGAKIAITRPGSLTDLNVKMLAQRKGWEVGKDVFEVALGSAEARFGALIAGAVDCAPNNMEAATPYLAAGKVRIIGNVLPAGEKWVEHSLIATTDLIKNNPDLVRRFNRAVFQAAKYMNEEKEFVIEKFATWAGTTIDLARLTFQNVDVDMDGTLRYEEFEAVMKAQVMLGDMPKVLTPEEIFAPGFVPEGGWSKSLPIIQPSVLDQLQVIQQLHVIASLPTGALAEKPHT